MSEFVDARPDWDSAAATEAASSSGGEWTGTQLALGGGVVACALVLAYLAYTSGESSAERESEGEEDEQLSERSDGAESGVSGAWEGTGLTAGSGQ